MGCILCTLMIPPRCAAIIGQDHDASRRGIMKQRLVEGSLKALVIDRFGIDLEIDGEEALTPVLSRMLARRTHRHYTADPVPENLLDMLLAVALSASSKSDFQQASVIRLIDPEKRGRIAALLPAMPWIGTAPVFFVFCADARRLERLGALRRRHDQPNGDLEAFLNATVDAALALQ